ncbi:hypothetical protein BDN72DRAFT_958332 [Pluteus cervinus]|uniref:Uncharacterized protein n=1 Tax=Pluteus cervinus TaxID=181527 RepID=A0ACD3AZ73_9AGAR|nr:hypothetical protein BDN72DRAFT_958332 [Pluteus cervinus]
MKVLEVVKAVTGFRTLPNTFLLLAIYIGIFTSIILTDKLPDVPKEKKRNGLDLDQALKDLHYITARPHPFNSHANDDVRRYLLSRIREILLGDPNTLQNATIGGPLYAHLGNDLQSNGSWASDRPSAPYGVYFEGTNILVKIDGHDPAFRNVGGVLFSAHYDSVSSAPGAVDDGMGVVTLLQLIKWFTSDQGRPMRTVIFNINNGEEDWLNGAHAYLLHPWSKITDTFLNLEGAGAGGRPILFRATSTTPLGAFSRVPHPHANVLSADAFARGVIRSGTDYSVYTTPYAAFHPPTGRGRPKDGPLMHGMDLAFYKGRARYHTKYDTIPWLEGGKKALWAMMETARAAGDQLANDEVREWERDEHDHEGAGKRPVYFDLFGDSFVVFAMRSFFIFNIIMLIIGPIFLGFLMICVSIIHFGAREERRHREAPSPRTPDTPHGYPPPQHEEGFFSRLWITMKENNWASVLWRWSKFWVAIVFGAATQAGLIAGYIHFNPFILYSEPYLVFLSSLLVMFWTYMSVFTLPNPKPSKDGPCEEKCNPSDVPDQEKRVNLWQTYHFTWILLLLSTLGIAHADIGGTYIFTIWNVLAAFACIIVCAQGAVSAPDPKGKARADPEGGQPREGGDRRRGVRFEGDNGHNSDSDSDDGHARRGGGSSETAPLIGGERGNGRQEERSERGEPGAIGWWFAELLLVVPIPLMLVGHVAIILLGAIPQTLGDGADPIFVYSTFSFLSLLLMIPLAPFATRIHRGLVALAFLTLLGVLAHTWTVFPFSPEIPLKVFFQQKLEVDLGLDTSVQGPSYRPGHFTAQPAFVDSPDFNSSIFSGPVTKTLVYKPVTMLSGTKYYLKKKIIPVLPSTMGQRKWCRADEGVNGLWTCEWETDLIPLPGDGVPRIAEGSDDTVADLNLPSKPPPDSPSTWIRADITPIGVNSARFVLSGTNTRSCRVYFDNRRITEYVVAGGKPGMQPGYGIREEGLKEVRLWSRTFGKVFVVDIEWANPGPSAGAGGAEWGNGTGEVRGRVACEWNEYESGSVGGGTGGKIPAFEEVLRWIPRWSAVSKASDGLVEVWAPFSL